MYGFLFNEEPKYVNRLFCKLLINRTRDIIPSFMLKKV